MAKNSVDHKRYLPLNHKWRNDKVSFDNTIEHRLPPKMLSGDDMLDEVADLDGLPLTKDPQKRLKYRIRKGVITGIRRVYSLIFHIGKPYCCDIILMCCSLRRIYVTIFWGQF
uniref:Uncharacterized protein n=1 Tax=Solanum tuberosum TaxID=4113 RepID=M1CWK4_SOLTU